MFYMLEELRHQSESRLVYRDMKVAGRKVHEVTEEEARAYLTSVIDRDDELEPEDLEDMLQEARFGEAPPIGFYPNGDPIFKCEECGLCGDDCDCFSDEDFFEVED